VVVRPTFTWVNLSDFWSPMKIHVSYRRSSDFWKREYLCTMSSFEKEHSSPNLNVTAGLPVVRSFFSFFKNFPSHSPIMSKIPSMGVTYEKNSPVKLTAGVDEANNVRGGISVIFGSQVSLLCHYCKGYEVYIITLLWQKWKAKWPSIVNDVFRIVQNHGE